MPRPMPGGGVASRRVWPTPRPGAPAPLSEPAASHCAMSRTALRFLSMPGRRFAGASRTAGAVCVAWIAGTAMSVCGCCPSCGGRPPSGRRGLLDPRALRGRHVLHGSVICAVHAIRAASGIQAAPVAHAMGALCATSATCRAYAAGACRTRLPRHRLPGRDERASIRTRARRKVIWTKRRPEGHVVYRCATRESRDRGRKWRRQDHGSEDHRRPSRT